MGQGWRAPDAWVPSPALGEGVPDTWVSLLIPGRGVESWWGLGNLDTWVLSGASGPLQGGRGRSQDTWVLCPLQGWGAHPYPLP